MKPRATNSHRAARKRALEKRVLKAAMHVGKCWNDYDTRWLKGNYGALAKMLRACAALNRRLK